MANLDQLFTLATKLSLHDQNVLVNRLIQHRIDHFLIDDTMSDEDLTECRLDQLDELDSVDKNTSHCFAKCWCRVRKALKG